MFDQLIWDVTINMSKSEIGRLFNRITDPHYLVAERGFEGLERLPRQGCSTVEEMFLLV